MDTLLGSETPRIWTPPLRPLTPETTLGFAAIEFAEQVLGLTLFPWQKWLFIHALEVLPDGTFRFRTVILLVARQSGKSTMLQVLALFFMYVRGVDLVIGTAQNLDIAEEVWDGAVDMAEGVPELKAEIESVIHSNGKKVLELRQGERYKVQPATRKGGRGLSGDFVILDELREHKTWEAWGAVSKTTLARPHAQTWGVSNAGDTASVVLRHLRAMAHQSLGDPDGICKDMATKGGVDDSLGIFEWSAPPGCDLDDRDGWAQSSPSLGYGITERAIRSALHTDPEWVFRTEVLCQWEPVEASDWELFSSTAWKAGQVAAHPGWLDGPYTYAIEVTPDRDRYSISTAGMHGDRLGVECGVNDTYDEDKALAQIVAVHAKAKGIVIDPRSPAKTLIRPLKELHGIEVVEVSSSDFMAACESLYDHHRGDLAHSDQDPALDAAAAKARKKQTQAGWYFDRTGDMTPLSSAALARWGHLEIEEPPGEIIF